MQHVLRCWEGQSDGSEYKKTLLVGGERLAVASPGTLSPTLSPSCLACPTPTPKLVPTPLVNASDCVVPHLQSGGCRFESRPGLLRIKVY